MSIENLLAVQTDIDTLWAKLAEADNESVEKLRALLDDKGAAIESAKKELRTLGTGRHSFDEYEFSVTAGPKKAYFSIEDVLDEAEDRGHLDELLKTGFVTYGVNATQLERLSPKLQAIYGELQQVKVGTHRVGIPKGLR